MVASAASPTTEWGVLADAGHPVDVAGTAPAQPDSRARSVPRDRRTGGLIALGDGAAALAVTLVGTPVGSWSVALPAVWLAALVTHGGYDRRIAGGRHGTLRRVVPAALTFAFGAVALAAATGATVVPAALVVSVLAMAIVATAGRALAAHLHRADLTRVVLVGNGDDVERMSRELTEAGSTFTVVHTCLVEDGDDPSVPGSTDLLELRTVVAETDADAVVVVPCRRLDPLRIRRIGWELERDGTRLMLATALPDLGHARVGLGRVGDVSLLHVRHADLRGPRQVAKQVCERALAALALVALAPVLLVLAAAVRLESDGPALFRQSRIGRDGHPFTMLKLRTMCADAEARRAELTSDDDRVLFKLPADPRVTRVGRFLRAYSLDELPQLLNVVRGEMALVGPRPPLPSEVEQYDGDTHRRLAVTPGLTGLWQVSGRSDLSWAESMRLDLRYVEHWSIGLDLRILGRTVGAVLGQRGAY